MTDATDEKEIAYRRAMTAVIEGYIKGADELKTENAALKARVNELEEMRAKVAELERDLAEADEAIFRTPKGHTSASLEQLAGLWKCPVEFARHHVRVDQENDALKARLSQIEAETIERCAKEADYYAAHSATARSIRKAIRSLSPSQGKPADKGDGG